MTDPVKLTPGSPFRFNWRDATSAGDDRNRFLEWLLPSLLATQDATEIEQLSELTERWTNVELTVQVNGRNVDATNFVTSLMNNHTYVAQEAVREAMRRVPTLPRVSALMGEIERSVEAYLRRQLTDAGIELPADEDD